MKKVRLTIEGERAKGIKNCTDYIKEIGPERVLRFYLGKMSYSMKHNYDDVPLLDAYWSGYFRVLVEYFPELACGL